MGIAIHRPKTIRTHTLALIVLITLGGGLGARGASPSGNWQRLDLASGLLESADPSGWMQPAAPRRCDHVSRPTSWDVRATFRADLNRDNDPECVLLVWRPWQDWPIMRWSDSTSPIANHHDQKGDSAHIILIDPASERELWAGSALAIPILQIAAGDVDGDGLPELVALEGDYDTGREGPARHVAVWRWNAFGFTLIWRSPPGQFSHLVLYETERGGAAQIWVQ
jgi:hypothetical protein